MRDIAVVTGAGGGLGQAIVAELANDHHVALIDIAEDKMREAVKAVGAEHTSIHVCDITSPDAIDQVAKDIMDLGPVRVLVNNAGQAWTESLHESTPESWKREISLNLDAAFYCFKAFESSLKTTQGANVVNIASVNALTYIGNPAYSAAKAGLLSLTSAIAIEYAQYGIRANSVAPGTVKTGAWADRLNKDPTAVDKVLKWYPLQRVILPEHIAKAVGFLSSENAATITGVCLPVDAGLSAGSAEIAKAITNSEYL